MVMAFELCLCLAWLGVCGSLTKDGICDPALGNNEGLSHWASRDVPDAFDVSALVRMWGTMHRIYYKYSSL